MSPRIPPPNAIIVSLRSILNDKSFDESVETVAIFFFLSSTLIGIKIASILERFSEVDKFFLYRLNTTKSHIINTLFLIKYFFKILPVLL